MNEALLRKLDGLKKVYAATLPGVAAEIEVAVHAWIAGGDGAEVKRLAHKIVGTAGSYGFTDVSAAARALEALTGGAADPAAARAAVERVVAACRAAAGG